MNIDCKNPFYQSIVNIEIAAPRNFIYIGSSLLDNQKFLQSLISGSQICIVTDEKVASLYLDKLIQAFSDYQTIIYTLPAGEKSKTLDHWVKILDQLLAHAYRRDSTLIGLGGGVVTDIAGFAASSYQRGIHFIPIPTTLLSQVDAAIGGKTAINYKEIKNLIGSFYQAQAIVIDPLVLLSLPPREFKAGLAEVIKYALIHDADFFDYLCLEADAILKRDLSVLSYVIEQCCRIKMQYVKEDERDLNKKRALLNFGHTFGHALESASKYEILHGEAVAWGMRKASELSQALGYLSKNEGLKILHCLEKYDLFFDLPNSIQVESLISFMYQDKKNKIGSITYILLEKIGKAFVSHDVDLDRIKALF